MKKIYQSFFIIVMLLVAYSCTDEKAYTIAGTVEDESLKFVYLTQMNDDWKGETTVLDSAAIERGKFEFKGKADSASLRFIRFSNSSIQPLAIIVEPGEIALSVGTNSAALAGTHNNDKLQEFFAKKGTMDSGSDKFAEYAVSFMTSGIPQELATYVYWSSGKPIREVDMVEKIFPILTEEFLRADAGKRPLNILSTKVGKPFVDLKAETPEGNEIALSSYVGGENKYTLVDFWESWCPPCRAELPELAAIYKEYKDKGFEILGVSLDHKQEDWVRAIDNYKMVWPQMSRISNPTIGQEYVVDFIPHTVLIDAEGKIVKRGISSNELRKELEVLLP